MKLDVSLLPDMTQRVCAAARRAGAFMSNERSSFDRSRVEEKNLHDYVSYVDRESEHMLVSDLSALLPGSGFMTEESTADYNDEAYFWIIDPLDGTTNYVHGQSPFAPSVALYGRLEGLLIGVVYEPCLDQCFYAWKGGGAYLNGKAISASTVSSLGAAYIHIGLPYDAIKYGAISVAFLNHFYGRVGGVRIAGSAAMDLCGIAAGGVDFYVEPSLHVWDVAAGILILHEAGGQVSDFEGHSWFDRLQAGVPAWGGYDVVAAAPTLYSQCLTEVQMCVESVATK